MTLNGDNQELLHEWITLGLARLNERERRVLERRCPIDGGEGDSLASISRDYGVSREAIRMVQATALRKLRSFTREWEACRDFWWKQEVCQVSEK